jgi:hypothetical protein
MKFYIIVTALSFELSRKDGMCTAKGKIFCFYAKIRQIMSHSENNAVKFGKCLFLLLTVIKCSLRQCVCD